MNKIKKIILAFLIIIFSVSIVDKNLQNDTFFTIPIAKFIVENKGLDGYDHWSYHENLKFTHSGWIFDLSVLFFYNLLGFGGCYLFTVIFTSIIGILFFYILVGNKKNLYLSFIYTLIIMYTSQGFFTARAQVLSYTIFLIEIILINRVLKTGKGRNLVNNTCSNIS